MTEAYEVKSTTDTICYTTNWINEAKMKGIDLGDRLSSVIINEGELGANNIKMGKMSEDSIEQAETHVSQFKGENADKYFSHPHKNLRGAASDFLRNFEQAKNYRRERQMAARPVFDEESYTKEFKKLGR